MLYDTATMEIIVRSVALSAFVETPRDVAIITDQSGGRSRLATAAKAVSSGLGRGLGIALHALRRGLPLAVERLAPGRLSGLAENGRPHGRCPA